jgi:hypothetical protein
LPANLITVPIAIKTLTIEQWKDAWESDCCNDRDHWCRLVIEDNGEHGDGINLEIRAGSHKVVRTLLPDESLDTLIAALTAIRSLRNTENAKP